MESCVIFGYLFPPPHTHTHTPATPHIHDVSHLARLDLKWVYLNLGNLVRGIYSWITPSTGVAIFAVAIVTILVATLVVCLIRSRRKTYKCVIVERDGKQTGNIIIG